MGRRKGKHGAQSSAAAFYTQRISSKGCWEKKQLPRDQTAHTEEIYRENKESGGGDDDGAGTHTSPMLFLCFLVLRVHPKNASPKNEIFCRLRVG